MTALKKALLTFPWTDLHDCEFVRCGCAGLRIYRNVPVFRGHGDLRRCRALGRAGLLTSPRRCPEGHHRHQHPGLRLRPAQALAARIQRKHQRPATPLPAPRHRPVGALRRRRLPHRPQPQRPAPQNTRIHETIRTTRRAHCAHRLNPRGQVSAAVDKLIVLAPKGFVPRKRD